MIENIYSHRLLLKYYDGINYFDNLDNNSILIQYRDNLEVIGYILQYIYDDYIEIKFDIIDKYRGIGLQTEALREYLRYKYLWEKKCDIIKCIPILDETINVLKKRYFIKEKNYYIINKELYMKRIEKLSLFDDNLNLLPYPNLRGEKIVEGTYAGIAEVLVFNRKNNKYLVTRRDLNKVTYPGYWEYTGGGIDFNENKEDAVERELKEETNLNLLDKKLVSVNKIKDLIYFTYIGDVECDDSDIILQKGEVIDYKWLDKNELIEFFNSDMVAKRKKEIFNELIKYL